uniref:(California timema) hypothetical protein n=1 Tax=Timema californicum TaxID=61474 RepID=A0A7R9J2G9_TIMCA|nr:unnamed protein product [Timema californicum]
MANCREIVSLQFGHYSNHIGAHWWNIQESSFVYNSDTPSEINHDVLFREGLTPSGYVTYTPRLLLVDLKGSLGHLPEKGELYEQPLANPEIVPWPREKVEVLTEPTTLKNEFLQDIDEENVMDQDDGHTSKTVVQDALKVYKLENVVKVWADYLRQRFHPRTVSIINKYEHANDSQPFNNYKLGANLWNTEQFEEDFTDWIRNLVEECDNMQARKIQNNYSTSPNCNMQLVTMLSTFVVVLLSVTTKLYLEKYRSESAFEIGSHNTCKHFVAKSLNCLQP